MSIQADYKRFLEILAQADDLQRSASILSWEKHVSMPRPGARWRGAQMTTLSTLSHERMTCVELGRLLDSLSPWAETLEYGSDEASLIRVTRRLYERKTKIPLKVAEELASIRNDTYFSWIRAREANDFSVMVPDLKRLVDLHVRVAEIWGYKEHILDPLIDEMEPGFTASSVEKLFDQVRPTLVNLVRMVSGSTSQVRTDFMSRDYPAQQQLAAGAEALKTIGFDMERGRVDVVVHPFCSMFSPEDIRVTTRVRPDEPTGCLFGCLHEGGHGLYDLGLPARLFRTPLCESPSAGIHESQSRMWENLVGRSRGFWETFYPRYRALFPAQLSDVTVEEWYRAVNRVRPTPTRVEADEVTYNLHIMLRYEIEKAVYDGKVKVEELRDVYNDRFMEYLGIAPPDDVRGVAQDIHWTEFFGTSYQGYTIGNIASVQFMDTAMKANPALRAEFSRGDYSGLLEWTRQNVHAYGAKFSPDELMVVSTGRQLDPKPYIDYVVGKYTDIYEL